ncbi:MAG: response regulator [Acidimicrobiia bacterium]
MLAHQPDPDPAESRLPLRVLIVDDAPSMRFLLATNLSLDRDCRLVGQAENGAEALEMVERFEPDLVVMDIQMPVMDGMTATKEITKRWPGIEVVGFSSARGASDRADLMAAGAVESFDKKDIRALLDFLRARARRV